MESLHQLQVQSSKKSTHSKFKPAFPDFGCPLRRLKGSYQPGKRAGTLWGEITQPELNEVGKNLWAFHRRAPVQGQGNLYSLPFLVSVITKSNKQQYLISLICFLLGTKIPQKGFI